MVHSHSLHLSLLTHVLILYSFAAASFSVLFELLKACWGFSEEPVINKKKIQSYLVLAKCNFFQMRRNIFQHAFPPLPPSRYKFIPAIFLLKWTGVGEGRNFTTVTVIGVENLTPYGRVLLPFMHLTFRGRVIWWTLTSFGRASQHHFNFGPGDGN